jgi:hypothetical protein
MVPLSAVSKIVWKVMISVQEEPAPIVIGTLPHVPLVML